MHLLLVDDEIELTTPLQRLLTNQGYVVDVAEDGDRGWEFAQQGGFDLLILDWMMSKKSGGIGRSGIEICRALRQKGDNTPVLFLTAKDTLDDRVTGLDSGADDYLIKPFELRELLARIRALLRRSPSNPKLVYQDLELDCLNQVAYYQNKSIPLSDKEAKLLAYLMGHPQQLLTHEQIQSYLWADEELPPSNALVAQIRLLRRKIDTSERSLIATVYGKGYRFG